MSSTLILLNSSTATSGTSDNFTIKYSTPIDIKGRMYEVALKKMYFWHTYHNISAEKGNNTFRYYNGVSFSPTITLPDGLYDIDDINEYLHAVMVNNGDYTVDGYGQNVYDIIIEPNNTTVRTKITLTNGYELDLSLSKLNLLLGCEKIIITTSGDCPYVANINDDINAFIVYCDIVSGNASYVNNNKSQVLYSFVPRGDPGYSVELEPINLTYLRVSVNNDQISEINIYILDNIGRRVNFNDQPVTYELDMRPIRE